jgi:hypothetical protein
MKKKLKLKKTIVRNLTQDLGVNGGLPRIPIKIKTVLLCGQTYTEGFQVCCCTGDLPCAAR